VANGADLKKASKFGRIKTPIQIASEYGHLNIIKYLIDNGIKLIETTMYPDPPIHMASKNGHLKIVEFLISKRYDINIQSREGHTALHFASENGHLEIVKLLIKSGADKNVKNIYFDNFVLMKNQ